MGKYDQTDISTIKPTISNTRPRISGLRLFSFAMMAAMKPDRTDMMTLRARFINSTLINGGNGVLLTIAFSKPS